MSGKINISRELKKLKELLDSEAITPAEYEEQKKRILDAANMQQLRDGSDYPSKKKRRLGCLIPTVIVAASLIIGLISVIIAPQEPDNSNTAPSNGESNTVSSSDTGTAPSSDADSQKNTPDLEVLDVSSKSEGYVRYATGHIRNNTDRTYSYVQVEINLFNEDIQVGSTLDNVTNLGPGATWEFSAPIIENNATRFEVANVTGY